MKTIFGILAHLLISSSAPSFASHFKLSSQIANGNSVEFLKFEGPGEFDSYLSMNLPFQPAAALHKQVQDGLKVKLKNRGEAHITVVTPVEYWNLLRPRGITMGEVNEIAESMRIQSSAFEVKCLGQGKAVISKEIEQTFYVVVASDDLIRVRKTIQNLLISKGGRSDEFKPTAYYPHITLGFTLRDLHASDGVVKNSNSCIGTIEIY